MGIAKPWRLSKQFLESVLNELWKGNQVALVSVVRKHRHHLSIKLTLRRIELTQNNLVAAFHIAPLAIVDFYRLGMYSMCIVVAT